MSEKDLVKSTNDIIKISISQEENDAVPNLPIKSSIDGLNLGKGNKLSAHSFDDISKSQTGASSATKTGSRQSLSVTHANSTNNLFSPKRRGSLGGQPSLPGDFSSAATKSYHYLASDEASRCVEWINSNIKPHLNPDLAHLFPNGQPLPTDPGEETETRLFSSCKDGMLLWKMIEFISPIAVDARKIWKKPKNKAQENENVMIIMKGAEKVGVRMSNIGAMDVMKGIPHLVMSLIRQLIKISLLSKVSLTNCPELSTLLSESEREQTSALSSEALLMRWINYHLKISGNENIKVTNFSADLRQGKVFALLIRHLSTFESDLKQQVDEIYQKYETATDNGEKALLILDMAVALGILPLISDAEILKGGKEQSIAFCAQLFEKHPRIDGQLASAFIRPSSRSSLTRLNSPTVNSEEVNSLKLELENVRRERDAFKEDLAKVSLELEGARSLVNDTKMQLQTVENEREKYRTDLESVKTHQQQEQKQAQSQNDKNEWQVKYDNLVQTRDIEKIEFEKTVETLKKQLESQLNEYQNQSKIKFLENEISNRQENQEKSSQSKGQLEADLKAKAEFISSLEVREKQANETISKLQNEMQTLKSGTISNSEELNKLKREVSEKENAFKQVKSELEDVKRQLSSKLETIKQLEQSAISQETAMEQNVQKLKQEIQQLQQQPAPLQQKNNENSSRIEEELQKKLKSKEQEIMNWKTTCDILKRELDEQHANRKPVAKQMQTTLTKLEEMKKTSHDISHSLELWHSNEQKLKGQSGESELKLLEHVKQLHDKITTMANQY